MTTSIASSISEIPCCIIPGKTLPAWASDLVSAESPMKPRGKMHPVWHCIERDVFVDREFIFELHTAFILKDCF